jgi:hypothetical protein
MIIKYASADERTRGRSSAARHLVHEDLRVDVGQNGELLDLHLFFFDRYSDLADYYRHAGHFAKADKLQSIAETHFQAAPDDDEPPPEAAAMAMPLPPLRTSTNAIGIRLDEKPARRQSGSGPARLYQHGESAHRHTPKPSGGIDVESIQ